MLAEHRDLPSAAGRLPGCRGRCSPITRGKTTTSCSWHCLPPAGASLAQLLGKMHRRTQALPGHADRRASWLRRRGRHRGPGLPRGPGHAALGPRGGPAGPAHPGPGRRQGHIPVPTSTRWPWRSTMSRSSPHTMLLPRGASCSPTTPRRCTTKSNAQHSGEFTWDYLETGPKVWRVRVGPGPGGAIRAPKGKASPANVLGPAMRWSRPGTNRNRGGRSHPRTGPLIDARARCAAVTRLRSAGSASA